MADLNEQFKQHRHTGTDSPKIEAEDIFDKQPAITAPSGTGTAGVDSSARNSINEIITTLENLGLVDKN